MTAAKATECTKRLTNTDRWPRHNQTPAKNATDQTRSCHKLNQMLQDASKFKQMLTDS